MRSVVEALVSVRRVAEFLHCEETSGPTLPPGSCQAGAGAAAPAPSPAISIAGSFGWGASSASGDSSAAAAGAAPAAAEASVGPVLRGIELAVPAGALVAVTGPVGSGKSSLLAAMLGEMVPLGDSRQQRQQEGSAAASSGFVAAGASVAYVPQDPWIMQGTLRCAGAAPLVPNAPWHGGMPLCVSLRLHALLNLMLACTLRRS